ncbi:MAG: PAS domain S-box protein [Bryobacteraceae bacterium]|nr:PAS domain S-box protein [Bryobacteraceae bacterium]
MKKRYVFALGILALLVLATLVVWQGSFSVDYSPEGSAQIFLFWAVSTLVFLMTITLSFMLFRQGLKLYMERQTGQEGSRLRTKLVVGALALSFLPVVFLVLFSIQVLNRNLDKWFSRPAMQVRESLIDIGVGMRQETQRRLDILARYGALKLATSSNTFDGALCRELQVDAAWIDTGNERVALCESQPKTRDSLTGIYPIDSGRRLVIEARLPLDLRQTEAEISAAVRQYNELAQHRREVRDFYILLLLLITLFILFFATWVALLLARHLSVPISALLEGARQVRAGNLAHRVSVKAVDELATLVRAFNEMTQALEANDRELERRRRFTEAILESIPTGVISLSPEGKLLRVNPALKQIFPAERVARAVMLEDLFSTEDAAEIRYLMKRARRTGLASRQLEVTRDGRTLHLGVTVTALEASHQHGYVLVIEDTSELLQAQRTAAWREVARRVAHEIKNPLTPIALSAERIARQLERHPASPDLQRVLRECSSVITSEVESVRALVDEFSQFARFPTAQRRTADLNEIVDHGLAVFQGRLAGIEVVKDLTPGLPPLQLDAEQVKRVVVNLVDNAAEAMQDLPLRRLLVTTASVSAEAVELTISDTGCGITPEDREKLFLPYFSTKDRGTGLGLAIVNHVLMEHGATIRVEDNQPAGARFIIEFPVATPEPALAL